MRTSKTIEKEIADRMAQQMQEEIDWGIKMSILKEIGYVHVHIEWQGMTISKAHEISHWCRENCTEDYHARGNDWYFKSIEEAVMFRLRWS